MGPVKQKTKSSNRVGSSNRHVVIRSTNISGLEEALQYARRAVLGLWYSNDGVGLSRMMQLQSQGLDLGSAPLMLS